MARAFFAALCLVLAVCVAAEVQIKTLQEDNNSHLGVSSGTYAIVQDGQVVGMVQRYSSEAPLRRAFGRRSGPSDDTPVPPHAQHLIDAIKARMDVFSALHDQLAASRCPFARQMALARLQAATAGSLLEPHPHPHPHPHMHPHPAARLGALPEGELPDHATARQRMFGGGAEEASVRGDMVMVPGGGRHHGHGNGHGMMVMRRDSIAQRVEEAGSVEEAQPVVASARPASMFKMLEEAFRREVGMAAAADEVDPEADVAGDADEAWGMLEASVMGEEEEEEEVDQFDEELAEQAAFEQEEEEEDGPFDPTDINLQPFFDPIQRVPEAQRATVLENPAFPRSPDVREALLGRGIAWERLNSAAVMPDGEAEPDMRWRFWTDDGELNWGLVTFVGLAVACAAVWGTMLGQYMGYCCAPSRQAAQAVFITRATNTAGDEDGMLKPMLHEGVQSAAAHVAEPKQNVTVLQYEPLK